MILYHGTTDIVANEIKKVGLKPHRETAYQIEDWDGVNLRTKRGEKQAVIYLTPYPDRAVHYARFRSDYERAEYGETVRFGFTAFRKVTEVKHIDVNPVVIAFDIEDDLITKKFKRDIQDYEAVVCKCEIPPTKIVDVIPIGVI